MECRQAFDTVADQYEAVRPGYPEALIERVLARARLTPDSRLLEIGCGSAIATLPYARRGHRILCLEPGPNLAAIVRRKLAAFPDVALRVEEFEAWQEEPDAFDLVYSAQAWHHLDPQVRDAKAARVLRAAGTLALYWNWPETNFEEGQEAYRAHVPEWADRPLPPIEQRLARGVASLTRAGCFLGVETHRFPWTGTYTADGYVRLVGTYSDHLLLPPAQRQGLFDGLRTCIERLGGTIERRHEAVLFLAAPVKGVRGR
ncbi:MAG: class I SAM-dependent methyltransferase [Planctomycetota bacterium]|jgi:SAM-dependent methyltransferase